MACKFRLYLDSKQRAGADLQLILSNFHDKLLEKARERAVCKGLGIRIPFNKMKYISEKGFLKARPQTRRIRGGAIKYQNFFRCGERGGKNVKADAGDAGNHAQGGIVRLQKGAVVEELKGRSASKEWNL